MDALPLARARTSPRTVLHPDEAARAVERARILVDGACDALLSVEHLVPEAERLVSDLERALPRLRAMLERSDQPALPLV